MDVCMIRRNFLQCHFMFICMYCSLSFSSFLNSKVKSSRKKMKQTNKLLYCRKEKDVATNCLRLFSFGFS